MNTYYVPGTGNPEGSKTYKYAYVRKLLYHSEEHISQIVECASYCGLQSDSKAATAALVAS